MVNQPWYWIAGIEVERRLAGRWHKDYVFGSRRVARNTDVRTAIACVVPRVGCTDKIVLNFTDRSVPSLLAVYDSVVLDYALRQKVAGTQVDYFSAKQLPIPNPTTFDQPCPWEPTVTYADWITPRVLELTYTAHDMAPFARDLGDDGPPFRWDPDRRAQLRAELDACFFHFYGLSRDDTAYVLDTFPIVRRNDEKAHNEFRTKRLILESYDAMTHAIVTGTTYASPLVPAPGEGSRHG